MGEAVRLAARLPQHRRGLTTGMGYLSGMFMLPCFGGPCDGQEYRVHLTSAPVTLRKSWVIEKPGGGTWEYTVLARYQPKRLWIGNSPRLVLQWLPEG
jgi:hypothetical protein